MAVQGGMIHESIRHQGYDQAPSRKQKNDPAAEPEDDAHHLFCERVEDEYYVTVPHEMSRSHYISFILAVKDNGCEMVKLYPEGNAEARFKINRTNCFYYYCNQNGLFQVPVQ